MKRKTMKRILAAMLTMVMLTGNLSIMASASQSEPPQATADEKPSVEIQGKVIKDQFGKLNGFFELALRVRTPENETFRDVAVAIEYDATVLQPVSWTAAPDETGKVETITLTGTEEYTVQQPAKKADGITTGVALTGDAATSGKNLLYFHAESQKGVSLPDMTTLAVIRFYVNPDKGSFALAADGKTLSYAGAPTDILNFIKFAPDVAAAASPAGQALIYASGDNLFYYTPVTETETVTVPGTSVTIPAPKTLGTKVLAVDTSKPDTDAAHYSYTSNQLDDTKVKLDLTCGESFSKDGVDIDKLCTITYLDWSGETIGTQVVPQNADARDLVNKYVKENFIHPDLRSSTAYSSLTRADTYRGAYPFSGPTGGDGEKRDDGAKYPLSSKLEYVFFKRVLEKDETTNPSTPTWKEADSAYDEAYPYIHGWARVVSTGDNWTTLGVGELENYDGATGSMPITDANKYFEPASFVDIKTNSLTVKAIYEPGEKLKKDFQYSIVGEPTIERYGYTASTENGTYAVKYQYERIYTDGYGVSRVREPVVKQGFTLDALAVNGDNGKSKPVYMEVKVENKDIIDVLLTPAGAVWQINYALVDTYGTNFVLAATRSVSGNSMSVEDNFNYNNFKYSTRQGSKGLVLEATLNTVLTEASKAARGENNEFAKHCDLPTLKDLNLRSDKLGTEFDGFSLSGARTKILAAVSTAVIANGNKDAVLTWHQLQYHLLNASSDGSGGIILPSGDIMSDADCKAAEKYTKWCRLIDGCVEGNIITVESLQDLLTIVHDNNLASINLIELTQINNAPLYLRADESGTPFTSVTDLIEKMKIIDQNAGADYINLTWQQVQYALLNGNTIPTAEVANAESNAKYFWRNGLTRVTDWASFLKAVNGASLGNSAALNLLTLDEINNAPIYLRADVNGTEFTADTLNEFKNKAKTLVSMAGENWAGITWEQAQFYFINGGLALPDQGEAQAESDRLYWWAGGGQIPVDLPTLLKAAQLANNGKPAALNGLTAIADLTDDAQYLKKNFKGEVFADIEAFKTAIKAAVGSSGVNMNWEQTQYVLIHGTLTGVSGPILNAEARYYWWKAGGAGIPVDFSSVSDYSSAVAVFLDAAYRSAFNGNIHAWDGLNANVLSSSKLIKQDNGASKFIDLIHFTDLDEFTATMDALAGDAGGKAPDVGQSVKLPTATWYQIQFYLIEHRFVDDSVAQAEDYWWRTKMENIVVTPEASFAEMQVALQAFFDSYGGDASAIDAWCTAENLATVGFVKVDGSAFTDSDAGGLIGMWYSFDYYSYGAASDVSWYQLEYFLAYGGPSYSDDATVKATLEGAGITIPDWVLGKWPVSLSDELFAIKMANLPLEDQLAHLTTKITELTILAKTHPEQAEQYRAQIMELRDALDELLAVLDGEEEQTPETPSEPEIPTEPETPTTPETPTNPDVPTDPEIPAVPETPTDPDVPTDPETPTLPETPTNPDIPAEPETPTTPEPPTDPEIPPTSDTGTPTEPLLVLSISNSTQSENTPVTYRWAQPLGSITKGAAARRLGDLYSGSYRKNPPAPSGAPPLVKGARAAYIGLFDSGGGILPAFPLRGTAVSLTPRLNYIELFPTPTLLAYLGGRTI